jgi:hypothetical protein
MTNFDTIKSVEPVTQKQVDSLHRVLGLGALVCKLSEVDLNAGRGVLEGNNRCLWTKDGHRITVTLCSDGGVIASVSKDPDPIFLTLGVNKKNKGL